MSDSRDGRGPLFIGGVAAILGSSCCLGPLVLVGLGFSGAWLAHLTALEPYRPLFLFVALVALFLAGRRIFRPVQKCGPGDVCAVSRVRLVYQVIFVVVALLALAALVFPYAAHWFY